MPAEATFPAFHVMTKPIGPICNLDCKYCFYLEKENLYPDHPSWQMSDEALEAYIEQYIHGQAAPEISFAWQGGEPTLLGVRFFRKVVALQKKHAGGKRISNALQTNGTLLDDEWGEFLHENSWLVGVSIDGPRDLHDAYRVDKQGRPTFDKVMAGIATLKKHKVEFNTLTVVNRKNSEHPLAVYQFLKEIGSGFIQFIPLVERSAQAPQDIGGSGLIQLSLAAPPHEGDPARSPVTEWSVRSAQYGEFLCQIFDYWVRRDVSKVFVQVFDVALANWVGDNPGLCVFSETCGAALAVEHNGDVYSCDHYVYPQYKLGNLMNQTLAQMVASPEQRQFGLEKSTTLPNYCRECEVRFACHGECPKHRFLHTPDGEAGLNYLCAGYKHFFNHIDPAMRTMGQLLAQRRAPAEIMQLLAQQERRNGSPSRKVGRNDKCPCGSGRKFKDCCLR